MRTGGRPIPAASALLREPGYRDYRDYRHSVVRELPAGTPGDDATAWAERVFAQPPRPLRGLVRARDRVAGLFGLRPVVGPAVGDRVGPFPVLSRTPDEVVFGLDDAHLDFRGSVCLTHEGGRTSVALSVVVQTHGAAGRAYLAGVRRAHPVVAAQLLRRAVRTAARTAGPEPAPGPAGPPDPPHPDEEHA